MAGATVTVVIPVYKVKPEYLRQCVASVLAQTYANFELILIDDGSPDSSGEICDGFAANDTRVSVIHQDNAGAAAARNVGMAMATGEYLAFVDADDWLDDDYLEVLVEAIPGDAQIISCCCKVILDDAVVEDHFFEGDHAFSGKGKDDLFYQLMQSSYGQPQKSYTAIGVPWGKLYRSDFLHGRNFSFSTKLREMEDNILNTYAFAAAEKVVYIDEPLYNYRYEHRKGFSESARAVYSDLFTAVSKARVEALEITGLMERPEMRAACDEEIARYLVSILNNMIYSPGVVPSSQRRERADALVSEAPFDEAVQRASGVNIKQWLWLFLARHRMWRIYGMLRRWRHIVKGEQVL